MEEESEKRRERLRAMRMEAEAEIVTSNTCSSSLSNPLLERPEGDTPTAAPRFGFYTDPMAAFSSDKRRTEHHLQPQSQCQPRPPFRPFSSGPKNPELPISGVHQFQNDYSSYQNIRQPGDPYNSPASTASSMGIQGPGSMLQGSPGFVAALVRGHSPSPGIGRGGVQYPMHQGPRNPAMTISGVHQFQNDYSSYQNIRQPGGDPYNSPASTVGIQSPDPMLQGSPGFVAAPGRGHWFNNSPSPGIGRGGGSYPMHQGSPNFRTPPQGRGRWSNNSPVPHGLGRGGSPGPNTGRGRGWDGGRTSPGSRYSGGRGRGPYFDGQARPFYDKSMVEDPWQSLTPMVWRGMCAFGSHLNRRASIQWTPSAKKPRVSFPINTSNSKQSLAEYLAASFDEAAGNATTSE